MAIILIVILTLGAVLFIYMVSEAFSNNVREHEMLFPNFPKSFGKVTIFFISDIHRRRISEKIINEVQGKAEIVIIGGDLTEKGVPSVRVKENLSKLNQIGPTYFVWGNNDYEADYHELNAIFAEQRVKVLNNTSVPFESKTGDVFYLLGVDDLNQKHDRLDEALMDTKEKSFKILVSHYPWITKKIRPEQNIQLVLSGHTHGGQIHIFGFSPYERGKIKQLKNTTLLISNGYGTTSVPLRLGAPAECHLITIFGDNKV